MQCHVAFDHALAEALETLALEATKQSDDVLSDLEWRGLKVQQSGGEDESKVNMDQATVILIDQNVGVVSVLNLENIAYERVSCQRIDQIIDSILVGSRLDVAEADSVEVNEVHVSSGLLKHLFLDVVNAHCVRDEFDDATIDASRENVVRLQLELELPLLKDEVNRFNQLHGELLRSEIVATLNNDFKHLPSLEMAVSRVLSHSLFLLCQRLTCEDLIVQFLEVFVDVPFFERLELGNGMRELGLIVVVNIFQCTG